MANLKNTQFFTFDQSVWNAKGKGVGEFVTVGHNRQIQLGHDSVTRALQLRCYLHGHNVATFSVLGQDKVYVELFTRGYRSTTTRAAMSDFMGAFLDTGSVSFARGGFGVRIKNRGVATVHAHHDKVTTDEHGYIDIDTKGDAIAFSIDLK